MKKSLPLQSHEQTAGLDRDMLDQVAAEILTYLAEDPARLDRFFAITGLSIETLRQAAGSLDFTTHLLDYIGSDQRLLVAFSVASGRDPAAIEALRAALAPRVFD